MSIYDAYAGVRLFDGAIGIRGGQMWLNDLGGLGAVGGAMVELRQRTRPGGRWRATLFGGFEPRIMDVGYEDQVMKFGGLVAYDGPGMRRHVVGFVHIRDNGMTERSVFCFTNYLPLDKRLFVYQAAECDVAGPGIPSTGSLTYFFANGRYVVNKVELQGTYHHGRSIDSRSIVRDQLDGRAVDPKALDGLQFESLTGRVTVSARDVPAPVRRLRAGPEQPRRRGRRTRDVRRLRVERRQDGNRRDGVGFADRPGRERAGTTRGTSRSAGRSARAST